MNLFLIGYRCTGKTSVGRVVADRLGWTFRDADAELARNFRTTISEMVAEQGWQVFRQRERETLLDLCRLDHCVIATGGGVILDPQNVADMKRSGTVVWLTASPDAIRERIMADAQSSHLRPALTEKGLVREIEETLAHRIPLYRRAMDHEVATDGRSVRGIAASILEKLEESGCL